MVHEGIFHMGETLTICENTERRINRNANSRFVFQRLAGCFP